MTDPSYELDRMNYEYSHHSQDSCDTLSSQAPQYTYTIPSSQETHIPRITRTTVTRKTRFVCISDTHNGTTNGSFKLPQGDVLIHAGDLTNQGNYSELEKTIKWIEDANFEAKIIIAASPTGPHTTFRIFGSPFSPAKGMWAFGYPQPEASKRWNNIPLDVDIVLTHTPPKYHCDERNDRVAAGCEYLRQALWRIRPRLAICGHVHEGRGAEIIQWDLEASNIKFKENGVIRWEDPGKDNKKMSHIDLTSKGRVGDNSFKNDGSFGDWENLTSASTASSNNLTLTGNGLPFLSENIASDREKWRRKNPMAKIAMSNVAKSLLAIPEEILSPARGQGGIPPSLRCDVEALSGRMGRRETCVVNAAMMASSWPHGKGRGGKKFNKPIVVDIDLPVWEEVGL
ncbi:hypothetical protein SS1G_07379 [Sclerotinia sclerotiorum 1980 UF-70]|uniref:Calcineurin-like phosphoesterase domain-containing protein n=1 Tax=Sclerotinia sclerotiorum (strain ATCC 18683 / 1980 / Ss-1) TaxID=665079 RepID=A7EPY0_SCLS1|nr:hypothetical protein SS1G_07379 [Sclerotinia sclerotiorum 1980 UF-70]EDO04896.1 hypothetical protein SS1G_07379 [Sclerotinia sclerotiorum 1980 UF-70]